VNRRSLWRPVDRVGRGNDSAATADYPLSLAILLHVLDILRFGRLATRFGILISGDLYRPHRDDRD